MTLTATARVWLGLFAAASLVELVCEGLRLGWPSFIATATLMPLLAMFMIKARRHPDPLLRWALVALVFSWLGDTVGIFILVKIMFFLVAQVAYSAAFWKRRRHSVLFRPLPLLAYAAVIGTLVVVMASFADDLWIAIVVYGVAIGLMAVLASGVNVYAAVGGVLFVGSDTLIAIDTFARPGYIPAAGLWIMASYLAAQFLLVWGLLRLHHRSAPGEPAAETAP